MQLGLQAVTSYLVTCGAGNPGIRARQSSPELHLSPDSCLLDEVEPKKIGDDCVFSCLVVGFLLMELVLNTQVFVLKLMASPGSWSINGQCQPPSFAQYCPFFISQALT